MNTMFRIVPLAALAGLLLTGCGKPSVATIDYGMGDRASAGQLSYTVVDATWKGQLGESYKIRTPEQRFLVLTISVTNGSGKDASIPLLQLEGPKGQMYTELADGTGVDQWIGLLRTISPAQTQQGRIVFDVPLTSYRLRLTDGGDPGFEKFAWVKIPLSIDADPAVSGPFGDGLNVK